MARDAEKEINDQFGHHAGDRTVLVRDAKTVCRGIIRLFVEGYDYADLLDQVMTMGRQIDRDGAEIDRLRRSQERRQFQRYI